MSFHDASFPRGDESVGRLADRSETEQLVVRSIRLWLDGPEAQARVWNEFASGLGPVAGRRALGAFEAYLETLARSLDRRLSRHVAGCPCIGRDEEALASLVTLASVGQWGAAVGVAARLVRAERLLAVTEAAAELGRLLAGWPGAAMDEGGSASRGARFRTLH